MQKYSFCSEVRFKMVNQCNPPFQRLKVYFTDETHQFWRENNQYNLVQQNISKAIASHLAPSWVPGTCGQRSHNLKGEPTSVTLLRGLVLNQTLMITVVVIDYHISCIIRQASFCRFLFCNLQQITKTNNWSRCRE